jgi:tyrosyl-tRNA synthetase
MPNFPPVDEQLAYIKKGTAEIIRESDLRERLEQSFKTGKPLRVKIGFDPTARTCTWATSSSCAS